MKLKYLLFLLLIIGNSAAFATRITASDQATLTAALAVRVPGDTIDATLISGTYTVSANVKNCILRIFGDGTEAARIFINAASNGMIITSDTAGGQIFLGGTYITLRNFYWKNSIAPPSGVFYLKGSHNRTDNCAVYNPLTDGGTGAYKGCTVEGKYNRVENSIFRHKTTTGPFMQVNAFGNCFDTLQNLIFDTIFSGGDEAIRMGIGIQTRDSMTYNYIGNILFNMCQGDVELVSLKCSNVIINNITARKCQGAISFRNGFNNVFQNSFVLGGGTGWGGVKILGRNNSVNNVYFDSLSSSNIYQALAFMQGEYDHLSYPAGVSFEEQCLNISVTNCLFYGCQTLIQYGYSFGDTDRVMNPSNLFFNNLLFVNNTNSFITRYSTPIGAKFINCFAYNTQLAQRLRGVKTNVNPGLVADSYGVYRISAGSPTNVKALDTSNGLVYSQNSTLHPFSAVQNPTGTHQVGTNFNL